MIDMNIVQAAVDAYRGNVQKYSVGDAMHLLHEALIEANGGTDKIDFRRVRDGKCGEVFALVEEILSRTIVAGLAEDDYFNSLVDFRNVKAGDQIVFKTEDGDTLFQVAEVANGTQGIRRQRLAGVSETTLTTKTYAVKIYEELNRMLAGQSDFNKFIAKVGESFRRFLLDEVYALWSTATGEQFGGNTYFPAAGAYDEDALLELISHVEAAANGRPATIIGSKKAIRNLAPSIQCDQSKSDLYTMGYYGRFYGSPVVVTPQRHKINSTEFVFDDNVLTIVAGDEKPIKCVYEGQSLIIPGNPMNNADLTQEYLYSEQMGMGIILANGNSGIGRYTMA